MLSLVSIAAAALIAASSLQSADAGAPASVSVAGVDRVYVDADGLAVSGYDPVSYFSGTPAPGNAAFTSVEGGATYRFVSAENKAAFDADPKKYAPQFGGYCAYGAAKGAKYKSVPETGVVVDGKLYLNKNAGVQKLWNKDRTALIVEADAGWQAIQDTPYNR